MKKLSDEQAREQLRQRIIGLGEKSLKKSYYPELQKRIRELEIINKELEHEIRQRKKTEKLKEKLEMQLRHVQKMEAIGTLAGGIAHDFNNILSAVVGYTELAEIHLHNCDAKVKEVVINDLDGVLRSAKRAKELVAQILSFSSQKSGQHVPVQLKKIVSETAQMLRALIPTTIAIEQDYQDDGLILADPSQLNQIIMNLGTNAYHAMREKGGTLSFEITQKSINKNDVLFSDLQVRPGEYLLLRVCDTGCGMSRSIVERIFEPYFSTKTDQGGTGLGLSVVHGIVTQHNGHISVYSELGKGTSFLLYFPCLQEGEEAAVSDRDQGVVQGGTERLLVVDDEQDLLTIMNASLTHLGYEVTTSSAPCEALDIFGRTPNDFDLLVTDMNMPGMSGAELISHIREIRPELPVVLCTGFSEMMNAENTRDLGAACYIMKPVSKRQLDLAIRGLIDS